MHILLKIVIGCIALCVLYALLFEKYFFKKNKEGLDSADDEEFPTETATPDSAATDTVAATDPIAATVPVAATTESSSSGDTSALSSISLSSIDPTTTPTSTNPTTDPTTTPSSNGLTAIPASTTLPDTVPANSAPIQPIDITAQQFYILKHALAMMKPVYSNKDTDKAFCISVIDGIGISASEITDIIGDNAINPSTKMDRIEKLVIQHEKSIGKVSNLDKLPPYINKCGTYTYSTI